PSGHACRMSNYSTISYGYAPKPMYPIHAQRPSLHHEIAVVFAEIVRGDGGVGGENRLAGFGREIPGSTDAGVSGQVLVAVGQDGAVVVLRQALREGEHQLRAVRSVV